MTRYAPATRTSFAGRGQTETSQLMEFPVAPRVVAPIRRMRTLLLAAGAALLLALARDHLAKHHNAVAIHERHARQALAVLEGVAHERLLRLEAALSHLVGLEGVGVLHLLAACLLAHLPLQLADAARRAPAAHETDRGVADLDFPM